MDNCKNEKVNCIFNKKTKKCVKPNPYIEYISYSKKQGIPFHITKKTYNENNISDIKINIFKKCFRCQKLKKD